MRNRYASLTLGLLGAFALAACAVPDLTTTSVSRIHGSPLNTLIPDGSGQVRVCKVSGPAGTYSWTIDVAGGGNFLLNFGPTVTLTFDGVNPICAIMYNSLNDGTWPAGTTAELTISELVPPGMSVPEIQVFDPNYFVPTPGYPFGYRFSVLNTNTVTLTHSVGEVRRLHYYNIENPPPPPPVVVSCVAVSAVMGVAITPIQLTASGGLGGPYTFVATGLPAGLSLSSTGLLSGTPTVSGNFVYTVTVTDMGGNTGSTSCAVNIEPPQACPAVAAVPALSDITNLLFLFADGSTDANWQGASKGFSGNVVVDGISARERTSGGVPFAGTIFTNDATLGAWQNIVNQNAGQASGVTGAVAMVANLENDLNNAFTHINGLTANAPAGFTGTPQSLNGLNTQNGASEVFVLNVTSGFQVSTKINITGDAGDVFIMRWDTNLGLAGYQGQVKFQSGGAIVPLGGLTPASFVHVAGDLSSSGGGSNPAVPFPQGPGIPNGADWNGGGFFTGYWLTTGDANGETHSFSNAIFVGGWYTTTMKFSMTSGTSGVHVECPR